MTDDASLVDFISERHPRYTLYTTWYLVHVLSRIYTTCIPVKSNLCPAEKLFPSFSK